MSLKQNVATIDAAIIAISTLAAKCHAQKMTFAYAQALLKVLTHSHNYLYYWIKRNRAGVVAYRANR